MIPLDHIIEVALLVLAAYLGGCLIGYGAHVALRVYQSRPQLAPVVDVPDRHPVSAGQTASPSAPRSAARRLAGAVEREDSKPVQVTTPAQLRPPDLPAPRDAKADNLRAIKGIGPKTESALNDLGIYHYDQVAAWTGAHIDWLEGRIAVKGRIRREHWVEQAVLLATAPA